MNNIRIYVFDTSYLIEYPGAVNNITGDLVIPAIVLKQLDGLKNSEKEDVARKAKIVSYNIREAQRTNKLKIVSEYKKIDMLANCADNVVVGTAIKLKETFDEVVLLTTDNNMKIAAESVGIMIKEPAKAEDTIKRKSVKIFMVTAAIIAFFSFVFQNNIGVKIILNMITFIIMIIYGISITLKDKTWKDKNGYEDKRYDDRIGRVGNFTYKGFDYTRATDRIAAGFDK